MPKRKKSAGIEGEVSGSRESREELVVSLIVRIGIKLQTALDRRFERFEVSAQEAAVLIRCVEAKEISAGKLAVSMDRDKGKITRFVHRLEAKGLLKRSKNARDQRSSVIRPAKRAHQLAPELKAIFREARKQLFAGFMDIDLGQFGAELSRLWSNAGDLSFGFPSGKANKRTSHLHLNEKQVSRLLEFVNTN